MTGEVFENLGDRSEFQLAADLAEQSEGLVADPDAIRASISNHFGGVRAARTHAQDRTQGFDE